MESVGCYRTKLLQEPAARRFAACLSANPAFTAVSVQESPRSAGKFFVAYLPSSTTRQEALIQRQEDKRQERAMQEGAGYVWCLDKDGGRPFFWCLSVSGEVYEVTPDSCSCPDHQYRASKLGVPCKHRAALTAGLGTSTRF